MFLQKGKFFAVVFSIAVLVFTQALANLPLPQTEEDKEIRLALTKIEKIFVYQSWNLSSSEVTRKSIDYSMLASPNFNIADKIIEERLSSLSMSKTPAKLFFAKPTDLDKKTGWAEIEYQYDATIVDIQKKRALLGSIQFAIRIYTPDQDSCAAPMHFITFNPETFIISEDLKKEEYETSATPLPEPYAIRPDMKVTKIHPSFDRAINQMIDDIGEFIGK